VIVAPPLSEQSLESFENLVVPRYLSFFSALVLDMLLPSAPARLAHLGCRTGFFEPVIADKMPDCSIVGVDASAPAIELARTKATLYTGLRADYDFTAELPTALEDASFTHAFAIHPFGDATARAELLVEMRRVLVAGGQALLALPLRGSFPEINDMIREFALRQDLPDLSKAVDAAAASRSTIETISEEFENAGLTEIDVDVQLIAVSFNNGREFTEDAIARLMVLPELRSLLRVEPNVVDPCMKYVHDAIGKYWSEGVFELTVNVGCASGRRLS
jgi:ubiquinone/menaquinone biosynthesis C-methylase UbiE